MSNLSRHIRQVSRCVCVFASVYVCPECDKVHNATTVWYTTNSLSNFTMLLIGSQQWEYRVWKFTMLLIDLQQLECKQSFRSLAKFTVYCCYTTNSLSKFTMLLIDLHQREFKKSVTDRQGSIEFSERGKVHNATDVWYTIYSLSKITILLIGSQPREYRVFGKWQSSQCYRVLIHNLQFVKSLKY